MGMSAASGLSSTIVMAVPEHAGRVVKRIGWESPVGTRGIGVFVVLVNGVWHVLLEQDLGCARMNGGALLTICTP